MIKINMNTVIKLLFLVPIITVTVFLAKIAYAGTDSATAGTVLPTSGKNINNSVTVYSPASTSFSFQNSNNTTSSTSPPSNVGNNMNWAYSPTINTGLPVFDAGINGWGGTYPPCPGDPSQAPPQLDPSIYANLPKTPICPDINGNFPHPYEYLKDQVNSLYSIAPTTQGIYTVGQIFCPDYCTVTRTSTPTPVAGQSVTSFQNASCPNGYVSIADFNEQPAIQHMTADTTLQGPFQSTIAFNKLKDDPTYFCSIYLIDYNTVVYPKNDATNNIIPAPLVPSGSSINVTSFSVPVTTSGFYTSPQSNSNFFNYAQSQNTCSSTVGPNVQGADTLTLPSGDLDTFIYNGQPAVGQWIPALTWSQFWNNVGGTFGVYTTSFNQSEGTCWGSTGNYQPDTLASLNHNDIWWHYYRFEMCQSIIDTGWYYTSSFVRVSHVCARIKPVWEKVTK